MEVNDDPINPYQPLSILINFHQPLPTYRKMSTFLLELSYLIGSITFIIGLKQLSGPDTARQGNLLAAAGMGDVYKRQILNNNGKSPNS